MSSSTAVRFLYSFIFCRIDLRRLRLWRFLRLSLYRRTSKSVLPVLFILSQAGCGRFLRDQDTHKKPFELDFQGIQCMSEIPEIFSSYFKTSFSRDKLHETTLCIDRSLDQFLNSVRGDQQGYYTGEEVRQFFEKYIFKRTISADLVRAILKFKAAILGGSPEVITHSEFQRFHDILNVVEAELLRVYPHLDILLLKDSTEVLSGNQRDRLNVAFDDLKMAVRHVLNQVNIAESDYSLPEIDDLMFEIQKFAGLTEPEHPFVRWRENIPILDKLKAILVGEEAEIRTQREITDIWNMFVDVYRLSLQYNGGIFRLDWASTQNFHVVDRWVEDLFSVLLRAVAIRNKSQIPFSRIDDMVDEVKVRQLIPKDLSTQTVKLTYRQFIERFLSDQQSELVAIENRHIVVLHKEYMAFRFIQNILVQVFQDKNDIAKVDLEKKLSQYDITGTIDSLAPLSLRDQKFLKEAWSEFVLLMNQKDVRHWDPRGRASVKTAGNDTWSYAELSQMNFFRGITSFLLRGYGQKGIPAIENELTAQQLNEFYVDFHKLGKEMKLFDLRNPDSASSVAKEADLFTPGGNGDGRVQFVELFDLLSDIWSGGIVGVNDFKSLSQMDKCELEELDYFGNPYLNRDCARATFHSNFPILFGHLPEFSSEILALNNEDWSHFYSNLITLSETCPGEVGLETGDQRSMMVVIHYVENLFSSYDRDRDGYLYEEEIVNSFPRFQNFMMSVTRKKLSASSPRVTWLVDQWGWEKISLNVYKFAVFNGRIPTSDDLGTVAFIMEKGSDGARVNRADVIKVLSVFRAEAGFSDINCQGTTSHESQ